MDNHTEGSAMGAVDLSVVIPVFNNASTLDELIRRLLAVLEPMQISFELVFVDDGSRDSSLALLETYAARDPRIRPLALTRNFASQAAVCAGLDQIRGQHGVIMDADLENCPEDIPALLEPLNRGYDLVCGYRERRRMRRRVPSWLVNAYVRRQSSTQIRDIGCGMRAFQSWVVRDLASEGEKRRLLSPVFLSRARRITEVPIRPGVTNPKGGHSFLTLVGIVADYYLLTARRPFLTSGLMSLAATAIGVAAVPIIDPIASLLIVAVGLLGVLASLVGEYCQRLYHLSEGSPFYQLRDLDEGPDGSARFA